MPPSLRTDLNIQQLPGTLPNVGGLLGANTIVTDPDFGTTIVRLSDGSTSNNSSIQTADNASAGIWNSNDTMILVKNNFGKSLLYQFNPTTLQGSLLSFTTTASVCFARTSPGILYTLNGTQITKNTFTLISGVWTFQSATLFADFVNILPGGYTPTWNSSFFISLDDTTFGCAFSNSGGQNTGHNVCVYQTGHGTGGYRMLDTATGTITGDWGTTGTAVLTTTLGYTFPFDLHETEMTPNPLYLCFNPISQVADTDVVWTISGLSCVDQNDGSHKAKGYLHTYPGGGGGQLIEIPYVSPVKPYRQVVPTLPSGFTGDRHFGFGQIVTNDAGYVWSTTGANTPQPFTSAWEGEVFGYTVATGVVYRACHLFNSFKSPVFIVANAIGIASQTGNFVAFCSDWGGVGTVGPLGSTSGDATGVIGGNARGDVFIVAIPFGTFAPTITSANNTTFTQNVFGSFIVNTTASPTAAITESGSLPSGVTFVDNGNGTATLSGTPTAFGTFPFTITAANGVSPNATQPFTLTVSPTVPPTSPAITSATTTTFTFGLANSFVVDTTGTPTPSISESGVLPVGVTFVDNGNGTGTLSGTPTGTGNFPITFTASNGVLPNAVQHFILTVALVVPLGVATAKFQFPNGNPVANGRWQWKLSFDALQIPVACMVPTLISGKLDANGNMTSTLAFNSILQTVLGYNTTYQLTVKDFAGKQVWNENYFLTGTAANLTLIPPSGGVE